MFAASAASLMFAASAASLMFCRVRGTGPRRGAARAALDRGGASGPWDKVTARISTISAPINDTVRFGSLRITARTCTKTPPTEPPEVTAFLEVTEAQPGELPKPVV